MHRVECVRKLRTHNRREREGVRQSITRLTSWDKNHHNFYYQLTTWTHGTTTTTIRCRAEPSQAKQPYSSRSVAIACVSCLASPRPSSFPLCLHTPTPSVLHVRERDKTTTKQTHTHTRSKKKKKKKKTIRKQVIALMDLLSASPTPSRFLDSLSLSIPLHRPTPCQSRM